MVYDVIVVGAGASGLYFSSHFAHESFCPKILVLEKNKRPGLKLLASGSGQCNFTHFEPAYALLNHYGAHKKFVKNAIRSHDNDAVMAYFKFLGVPYDVRADGKVFPKSKRSKEILSALLNPVEASSKIDILYEAEVINCEKYEDVFQTTTSKGVFFSKMLVVASGGLSYPQLGASGIGYEIAKNLGHSVTEPRVALAAVYSSNQSLKMLMGTVLESTQIHHKRTGKIIVGDLLITHFGLSGPVIIDHSKDFELGDQLLIKFSDDANEASFLSYVELHGEKPLSFYLNQLGITERIKQWTLDELKINGNIKLSEVDKATRRMLIQHLSAYPVSVDALSSMKEAMATAGGVSVSEIDPKTMASKCCQGLYFLGEVQEVVGDTGGYNLQWAFSSAYSAMTHIKSKIL